MKTSDFTLTKIPLIPYSLPSPLTMNDAVSAVGNSSVTSVKIFSGSGFIHWSPEVSRATVT